MALYFAPSVCGFFSDAVHADIPADAVEISAQDHARLLDQQASGAAIVAGADGFPRANHVTVKLKDRRAARIRQVKREAARRIESIAPLWRQLNDQHAPSDEGAARFTAIDAIRAASDMIEAEVASLSAAALDALDIARHPLWPES